ncbi:MAG: hypothetical protein HC850_04635, partial [Rhodomicrobium sp.]|nr:hypothetical protein [Rhodomicrobium sp.]
TRSLKLTMPKPGHFNGPQQARRSSPKSNAYVRLFPGQDTSVIVDAAVKLSDPSPGESRLDFETRIEKAMRLAARAELNGLQPRVRFLATVGSTAPFVGLFGTVWGIMNSFTAIAAQKDTSLAVVAPGIAEALFATVLGLVAAVPAVVAYNQITGAMSRASERINLAVARLTSDYAGNLLNARTDR